MLLLNKSILPNEGLNLCQISTERCIVIMFVTIGLNMLLIRGASGRVARRAAALLAQRGYCLRLKTRTPQQAPKLDGAELTRGDFAEPATLDDAFAGVSTACCRASRLSPNLLRCSISLKRVNASPGPPILPH